MGSESTGQARDHLPIYKLGLPDRIFGVSDLKKNKLQTKNQKMFLNYFSKTTVDVIYVASNKDNTAPGASGEVQDHHEHHQDDQEQLQDHFLCGFYKVLRGFKRVNKDLLFMMITSFLMPVKTF